MSGRRLRNTVQRVLLDNGFPSNVKVVIAGLSNTYSSYVTTYEEYQVYDHSAVHACTYTTWFSFLVTQIMQVQRYEGASTVYGPYTLDAYLQEFGKLAAALAMVA